MPWTDPRANSSDLKRCIRDLVALSTLPAAWQNYDMPQIGSSIVAALISMLDADFVFIALPDHDNQFITELTRNSPKLDPADREYFSKEIEPLLSRPFIEFVGEIGERDKGEFLGNAAALLFPIDWPEPFGLVMIEALACGTPVIAFDSGSVPEIIENGITGFVVSNIDEAASAVGRISTLNRRRCRETFERRFSASRMASDYLDIYRRLVSRHEGDGAGMTVFRPAA